MKTRSLAARFVEQGSVRLSRAGQLTRLDKASRSIRPGDELIFVLSERVFSLRIEALGDRRGPAPEARSLYSEAPSQAQG